MNFKIHKGGLPCPENYRNNPGGQCAGGVGALASTRNRGCTYSHSNGKGFGFSCPPASLDSYIGEWQTSTLDDSETVTFSKRSISELDLETQNKLKLFEQETNTTIVGNEIAIPSDDDIYFVKLNVSGEICNNIYLIGPDEEIGFLYVPANPVEFSVTVEGNTFTYKKV